MSDTRLLTLTEVANRAGVSYQTAWRWVNSGRLRGIQTTGARGGQWRFDPAVVERFLAGEAVTPPPSAVLVHRCPDTDALTRAVVKTVEENPELARQLASFWAKVLEEAGDEWLVQPVEAGDD